MYAIRSYYGDLRIDFKSGTVDKLSRVLTIGRGVKAGVACDLEVLFAHSLPEAALHRVAQDFLTHLGAELLSDNLSYNFV